MWLWGRFPAAVREKQNASHSSNGLLRTGLNRYLHGKLAESCLWKHQSLSWSEDGQDLHCFLQLPSHAMIFLLLLHFVRGQRRLDAEVLLWCIFTGSEQSNYLLKCNATQQKLFCIRGSRSTLPGAVHAHRRERQPIGRWKPTFTKADEWRVWQVRWRFVSPSLLFLRTLILPPLWRSSGQQPPSGQVHHRGDSWRNVY